VAAFSDQLNYPISLIAGHVISIYQYLLGVLMFRPDRVGGSGGAGRIASAPPLDFLPPPRPPRALGVGPEVQI
jgi:hypothetical protein